VVWAMTGSRSCIPYLQLLVLALLEKRGPLCGYRIFQVLSKYGVVSQPAAVYNALQKLQGRGCVRLVEAKTSRGRAQRYSLTPEGRRYLRELMEEFKLVQRAMEEVVSGHAMNATPL